MATPTVKEMTAYIRQAAIARGINPDIAVKVARSEGLAPGVWQSNVYKNGRRETSYGPFQLLVGGGLGDKFKKVTGNSPSDKSTWQQQVDFALDHAAENGWSSWYGAAKVGVGKWTGLKGAEPVGISPSTETAVADAATPEMAGGLGALLAGNWVEPMLAANQDRIGSRIESAFAPGPMPTTAGGALDRLAGRISPVVAAPQYGPPQLRPFNPGERRSNPDGSYSTELSTTWQMPDGQWVNVPSLWMGANGPVQFDPADEQGIMRAVRDFESMGAAFPRFPTLAAAEAAARARSQSGGVTGTDRATDRVGQAFLTAEGSPTSPVNADALARAVASMQGDRASNRVASAFDTAQRAPMVQADPSALARAVAARDPNARINQAFAVGGAPQALVPGVQSAIDRIRASYAPTPTPQTGPVAPSFATEKTDRLPAGPSDIDRTRAGLAQYADARKAGAMTQYAPGTGPAAEWAARSRPEPAKALDAGSLLRAANVLDKALGPLGTNIMRVVDAVRSPSGAQGDADAEQVVTTKAGRQMRPVSHISLGPGATTPNTGLSAISSVMSGRAPVGAVAFSRSNPGFSVMGLPTGNVARTSSKYGWTEVYSPADDDVLGIHYGKVIAVDPTGTKHKAVTPEEAKGLAAKGWSVSSKAHPGFGKAPAPGTAMPGFLSGLFGGSKGKGFLSGLFGPNTKSPIGLAAANVAAASRSVNPTGLAGFLSGLFSGPSAGGLGGGFSGGGLGGNSGPSFGGAHSDSDYSGL